MDPNSDDNHEESATNSIDQVEHPVNYSDIAESFELALRHRGVPEETIEAVQKDVAGAVAANERRLVWESDMARLEDAIVKAADQVQKLQTASKGTRLNQVHTSGAPGTTPADTAATPVTRVRILGVPLSGLSKTQRRKLSENVYRLCTEEFEVVPDDVAVTGTQEDTDE